LVRVKKERAQSHRLGIVLRLSRSHLMEIMVKLWVLVKKYLNIIKLSVG